MNIEEMLSEFNSNADGSKALLRGILDTISAGKVPADADMQQLNKAVADLRERYDHICSVVASAVSADELPEEGASVTDYAQAMQNSIAAAYRQQLMEIKSVLDMFVSVQAQSDRYAEALQEYQNAAKELVATLDTRSEIDDELEQQAAGPKAFMAALTCEDPDSDEAEDLVEKAGEYYSRRVTMGLTRQMYYLPTGSTPALDTTDSIAETENTAEENTKDTAEKNAKDTVGKERTAAADPDTTATAEEQSQKELPQDEPAEKEPAVTPTDDANPKKKTRLLTEVVTEKGIPLEDTSIEGTFVRNISPNEKKGLTANAFRRDVQSAFDGFKEVVLKSAYAEGIISANHMKSINGALEYSANSALEGLYNSGYLRYYGMESRDGFYCPSPLLKRAMMLKDIAKIVKIGKYKLAPWSPYLGDTNASILTGMAYEKIQYENVQAIKKLDKETRQASIYILPDSYMALQRDKGNTIADFNIGIFWNDASECNKFVAYARETLGGRKKVRYFTVAAYDMRRARELVDLMARVLQLKYDHAALYDFKNDQYYSYPDCTPIKRLYEPADEDNVIQDVAANDTIEDSPVVEVAEFAAPAEREDAVETAVAATPVEQEDAVETVDTAAQEQPAIPEIQASEAEPIGASVPTGADAIKADVVSMINGDRIYAAVAYANCCAPQYPEVAALYERLAYALDDPMAHYTYSTEQAFKLMGEESGLEGVLALSAAARTFFSNQVSYDYDLQSYYDIVKEYPLLKDYPNLSKVFYDLFSYKNEQHKGMDAYADYHFAEGNRGEDPLHDLQQEASDLLNNYVRTRKSNETDPKRLARTKKRIFDEKNDLCGIVAIIEKGDTSMQPYAAEYLQKNFYRTGTGTNKNNTIDDDKVDEFIEYYWAEAGKDMANRKYEDLVGDKRANLVNQVKRFVGVIAAWCEYIDRRKRHPEDAGKIAYNKVRNRTLGNIDAAVTAMQRDCDAAKFDDQMQAGMRVLIDTMKQLRSCLDGTREDGIRRYDYAPFLLTGDVLLDNDYLPDLEMHATSIAALMPATRIKQHVQTMSTSAITYEERLQQLLGGEDDYGSAELIAKYLAHEGESDELEQRLEAINSSKSYADDNAKDKFDDFVGSLELAQSYGQIDNSKEDQKEKILQIVDKWYQWASETSNYGFFKRVMNAYLEDIRENAKAMEQRLQDQLDQYIKRPMPTMDEDTKARKIDRIRKMLDRQNYTVAEDLLRRFEDSNEFHSLIEEDYLEDYLNYYNDYYKDVSDTKTDLRKLIKIRGDSEKDKAGKSLIINWPNSETQYTAMNLSNLLKGLGFGEVKAEKVTKGAKDPQFEVQVVTLQKRKGHPIAAFGSGAVNDGFRVICIDGDRDADALINDLAPVSTETHALVLLDCALNLMQRRRLARRSKAEFGDKLIGIIDRTVLMYLIRKYDPSKVNGMLMSLVVPFAYYQPYVPNSGNAMPPEIFMGRRKELEDIKSSNGVNIVYGGRQLGKSALLKKAQKDIDHDAKGDRAVFVDVKKKDYKEAARKIGLTLYEEHVLDKDPGTDDWDKLAAAIRTRLKSEKDRIPYLLLLIDEADCFIESCGGDVNYHPFDALKDIQSTEEGRFKFVVAGLRDVVRFKMEALNNNSVLTQLGAMTVKPFAYSEARELLEVPLHYVGFRFKNEDEELIPLILATANYFPGLIQLYCEKLIRALQNNYADYNENDNPPYYVSKSQIKKILSDKDFTREIREKFYITLALGEDDYYQIIALLMAYKYHTKGYRSIGYSPEELQQDSIYYHISKIASLDLNEITAIMEEMSELNVLRHTDKKGYLFTRYAFFQMMGTASEVDDKLQGYIED